MGSNLRATTLCKYCQRLHLHPIYCHPPIWDTKLDFLLCCASKGQQPDIWLHTSKYYYDFHIVCFPCAYFLDHLVFNPQTNVTYYRGIWHALRTITREEGASGLYKGLGATLLVKFLLLLESKCA